MGHPHHLSRFLDLDRVVGTKKMRDLPLRGKRRHELDVLLHRVLAFLVLLRSPGSHLELLESEGCTFEPGEIEVLSLVDVPALRLHEQAKETQLGARVDCSRAHASDKLCCLDKDREGVAFLLFVLLPPLTIWDTFRPLPLELSLELLLAIGRTRGNVK